MMVERVLITGGKGRTGRRVASRLIASGEIANGNG
jgi:nucleoside-diphosphate-sugar epimerase